MFIFTPSAVGKLTLSQVPHDFSERMADRVEDGLLMPGMRTRANYSVRNYDSNSIHFGADDIATAANVGLNEVRVTCVDEYTLSYEFSFHRWARYTTWLCLAVLAPLVVLTAILTHMTALHQAPLGVKPAMWFILIFWGVVWPQLLVSFHRGAASRCLERILREVCQDQAPVILSMGKRYDSRMRFLGIPVVSIALGPDPETGQMRGVARGYFAFGDIAIGFAAFGGMSFGVVAIGGVSIGGLAIGGAALGACALGGVAIGLVALGGLAIGLVAVGGYAIGLEVVGGATITPLS